MRRRTRPPGSTSTSRAARNLVQPPEPRPALVSGEHAALDLQRADRNNNNNNNSGNHTHQLLSTPLKTLPPNPRSTPASLRSSSSTNGPPTSRTTIPPSLNARVVENGILAAAMKVFAKRGFAATRVEDVLDEAGVARRTFYRYFTSKEDVLAAVYELATSELLRALDEAGSSVVDPLGAVRAGVDLYLDFHVENAALLRVLVEQSVRSDSPLAGLRRRFRAQILKVMVRAAEARGVAPLDGFTYVALVSALEGVALELLEGPALVDEVERAKSAIHRLVESGLGGAHHHNTNTHDD